MKDVLFLTGRGARRFAKFPIRLRFIFWLLPLLGALPLGVQAVPYASGITNNAGTVSFFLNESADSVKVVFDGGAGGTNDLGQLGAGQYSFALGAHSSFRILVQKAAGPGYLTGVSNRIGSASNVLTYFFIPRGVAVNRNPASPNFGRIYVSEGQGGATSVPGARTTTDGIFILNPDLTDAVGQGNSGRTGGVGFTPASQNSNTPWKIEVGEDDTVYIADWTTAQGTIWVTDPNVTTASNLLAGIGVTNPTVHTTISSSPIPLGSLAAGNLTIWAIDGQWPGAGNRNRLLRWNINGGPIPFNSPPTPLGSAGNGGNNDVYCDVERGPDGKLYVLQNRANGTDTDSLRVYDADGTTFLWQSLVQTGNPDALRQIRAVKISPDGKVMALNRDDGRTWIVGLINGIPDMSNTNLLDTFISGTSTGRDVAFDAAGNLYVVNNNQEQLRIYSPGGSTVAATGSDGTFIITRPPAVSVTALDSVAAENGVDPGTFRISRAGDNSADLPVTYTLTGLAVNGGDYGAIPLSTIIPAGMSSVDITLTPIDDSIAELTEPAVLTLSGGLEYDLAPPASATINILDNEYPNVCTIVAADTNIFERFQSDTGSFTVTRYGDTNVELFLNFQFSGQATENVDFSVPPGAINLFPGAVTKTITVTPVDDMDLEGDETIVVTLASGLDYTAGLPDAASMRIRDDEWANAPIAFSDDFESDTSGNWTSRFGAGNGIYDATNIFAYDYVAAGIPLAPHSASLTSKGLYVAVNKYDTNAVGAAGLNLYPVGRSFSGDYTLRYDMFLSFGTAGTTEHAMAGLNHSTLQTNRVTQNVDPNNSARGGDGIWVAIETDGSANRDYTAYTTTNANTPPAIVATRTAAAMAGLVTSPPFAFAGSPGNSPSSTKAWASVELSQIGGIITLKVDGATVFSFTNTTPFTSGDIMLGHSDQFDSIGSPANYVIFDNVQVIDLNFAITGIQFADGNQVQIDFRSPTGAIADFHLQSSDSLSPPSWVDDNNAVITATANGFRATTTHSGEMRYYRIRR